ncbi:helix-turn-helix transcriptional regulator [Rhizobium sp. ZK1]|uniref:helix-turn-helix transcriptional regulator n=1 Tax=Rhizobium TaxID=379 RepID=UPI0039F6666C
MNGEISAISNVMSDFFSETSSATSKDALLLSFGKISRYFGFTSFAISGIPSPNERIDPYLFFSDWSGEWFDRYLEGNFVHIDPVVHLSKTCDRAFIWSEVLINQKLDRQGRRVMNEASEFKMIDGYTIPLHTAAGFQSIVSFGAEKVDLSNTARRALYVLSAYAHSLLRDQIVKDAKQKAKELPRITAREREIIHWCAAGKTAIEIAKILGRSHRTIQNEVFNVQRKLDVVNTPQMVAESFRFGIIR